MSSVAGDLMPYINLKGIVLELVWDKMADAALEKLKEKIPGEIDDVIIEMMKPILREELSKRVDQLMEKVVE